MKHTEESMVTKSDEQLTLGVDMGAGSIGWFLQIVDNNGLPKKIIAAGSRIFGNSRDPKTRVPLSVQKRLARGASTRRDRQIMRTQYLCKLLKNFKLLPPAREKADVSLRNPYKLRAKAVNEKIDLYGIGRAILHINKRRGFKSNRKADKHADVDESSKMKTAINSLRKIIGDRTLGEYLYERQKSGSGTRMRATSIKKKNNYEIYADREMYVCEFRKIWETQRKYHKNLTEEMGQKIADALFFQRCLKTPERGFCQFEKGERRAYKAYPIFQKMRILQEVNALEIVDNGKLKIQLTVSDRKKIADILLSNSAPHIKKGMMTFAEMKKVLGIGRVHFFNFEAESRKGFYADSTMSIMSASGCFGEKWNEIDDATREKIIDAAVQNDEDEFKRIAFEKFGFTGDRCDEILDAAMALEDGTAALSAKAMHKIVEFLESGDLYHVACAKAGYNFNADYEGELRKRLPYYGEILRGATIGGNTNADASKNPEKYYGKITNPTVHVALNQLRKVVNKIFDVYGIPDRIVVETARELPLGEKGLGDIKKRISDNQKENEKIGDELEKLKVSNNAKNRMKYRLWSDLNPDPVKRCCPFCGKPIPLQELFTPSFEIEHLLPFSITFDDSRGNKVVSCASCNRIFKGKHSPYEAFGNNPSYKWDDIVARVSEMPWSRQWRFKPDALETFEEKFGDFISRMLNDTRYMSRIAREYLTSVLPKERIISVPGTITGRLRSVWGLNRILDSSAENDDEAIKNRDDLRHHAVDAFIISSINNKLIADISRTSRLAEEAGLENLLRTLRSPFSNIGYEDLKSVIDNIKVSHKLDRGDVKAALANGSTVGKLHKDTAYGKIGEEKDGKLTIAKRVPLTGIDAKRGSIEQIANPQIREALLREFDELVSQGLKDAQLKKCWAEFLMEFSQSENVRRVRIHLQNRESYKLIKITDKSGKVYKYMDNDETYCIDIFKPSKSMKWEFEVVNMYDAHKNSGPQWRKMDARAKLVMRLFKNDTIAYEENGEYKIARIIGIATHGQISLAELQVSHIEGNPPKKMPGVLQQLNARKVHIDEIGRVYDPKKQ